MEVKSYLEEILETLKGFTATSSTPLRTSILRKIIVFNRPRLQAYVTLLSDKTHTCLETPSVSTELSDKLSELRDLAVKANDRKLEESQCEHDFGNPCR